eukprot:scaffold103075_cov40-Prasinocladus_malaysianus.AAC.1
MLLLHSVSFALSRYCLIISSSVGIAPLARCQLARLPQLQALRNELYSPEFRQAVERMTGCGSLNDRTDMSANVYSQGHHLLCHDDVIGTRRVSYIIYLTCPDDPWTAQPPDPGRLSASRGDSGGELGLRVFLDEVFYPWHGAVWAWSWLTIFHAAR